MGACFSAGEPGRESKQQADAPKATTEVDAAAAAKVSKFCGTPGYDMEQRVPGTAIFFADFDQTFAKAHTFKVRVYC
jgi:hypothetical protein